MYRAHKKGAYNGRRKKVLSHFMIAQFGLYTYLICPRMSGVDFVSSFSAAAATLHRRMAASEDYAQLLREFRSMDMDSRWPAAYPTIASHLFTVDPYAANRRQVVVAFGVLPARHLLVTAPSFFKDRGDYPTSIQDILLANDKAEERKEAEADREYSRPELKPPKKKRRRQRRKKPKRKNTSRKKKKKKKKSQVYHETTTSSPNKVEHETESHYPPPTTTEDPHFTTEKTTTRRTTTLHPPPPIEYHRETDEPMPTTTTVKPTVHHHGPKDPNDYVAVIPYNDVFKLFDMLNKHAVRHQPPKRKRRRRPRPKTSTTTTTTTTMRTTTTTRRPRKKRRRRTTTTTMRTTRRPKTTTKRTKRSKKKIVKVGCHFPHGLIK